MRWAILLLFGSGITLCAQQTCLPCHPAETKLHLQSRMAHAMVPAQTAEFGLNLPDGTFREGPNGYQLLYRNTPAGVTVQAERGSDHAAGLIRWVLGAGAQGQTPLVDTETGKLESRISYFPKLHQYGITIGQNAGTSTSALAALGAHQSAAAAKSCIGCHATTVDAHFEPVVPGVQCQRCHAGAGEHAADPKRQVVNPGKLKAIEQTRLCGTCHRIKAPVDDNQLENVRFQPLRLTESKCFLSGKLECTTCHVAHQDARRNSAASYNEKCQTCHAPGTNQPFHGDNRQQGDCIGCHMPYVELHPALKFTDHRIRVVKTGDYPAAMFRERPS